MTCALYARVSTTDQNCDLQLRELREYCERRNWTVAGEYVDTGWSGAKASRPQFDRIQQDARMHRFDAILVWKLDRWGRSLQNLVASLGELETMGIRWISITQGIDTDKANPTSRLVLHILAAVAEWERETIRERVKAGMRAAQHRGKRCGRPKKVFNRARAQKLRETGASLREIAAAVGVSRGTIERLLR